MDNLQTTGHGTALTAHLNWDARIRMENKDRFRSTVDVRSGDESRNILKANRFKAAGVSGCLNINST